jgi:hypothetical protein
MRPAKAIANYSFDLIKLYDKFLKVRTDALFAKRMVLFPFGYAMFKVPG